MPIKITNLSIRNGPKWVLRDVSFSVDSGEVFGIFGTAGSGKSTLLELIDGTKAANGGTVRLDGSDIPASQQKQTCIRFPRTRSSSLLARLGLRRRDENAAIDIREFSAAMTGSASRAALLDEPFTGLHENAKIEYIDEIRTLAADTGKPVLIAASNYADILESCDHVAVLANGTVEQTGTPQDVYDRPETVGVASIVGRSNLLAARRLTSSKSDLPEFITIEGEHRLFAQRAELNRLGAINQNITLAIRPEQISISFGASFPEDNLLKATVTGIKPLGATTRVEFDCGGLRLEALVLRLVGLDVGEECMVGLPPDRIAILSR
jgi:ABC-type Fe3+/spermidine/putrescine transport system ATPase subunit